MFRFFLLQTQLIQCLAWFFFQMHPKRTKEREHREGGEKGCFSWPIKFYQFVIFRSFLITPLLLKRTVVFNCFYRRARHGSIIIFHPFSTLSRIGHCLEKLVLKNKSRAFRRYVLKGMSQKSKRNSAIDPISVHFYSPMHIYRKPPLLGPLGRGEWTDYGRAILPMD